MTINRQAKAGQNIPPGLPYYILALAMVPVFVETFQIWQWLSGELGTNTAAIIPPAALVLVLTAFGARAIWLHRRGGSVGILALLAGAALAGACLALTDPQFPAKRIHVVEYILLSLVVRKALSFGLEGMALAAYSAVITLVLGVHDEMIQGLHPDRTFGLMDITVNGVSGVAGALMAHGLGIFGKPQTAPGAKTPAPPPELAFIAIGAAMLVVALPSFKGMAVPWWTMTPLLGAGGLWFALIATGETRESEPHSVCAGLCLMLAIYPPTANWTSLVFL